MSSRQHAPDPGELRRLAARRRALGERMRRVLPGVLVGSTTLLGTGGLAAWVSSQAGVGSTAGHRPTPLAVAAPATPPTTDLVRSLQLALRADETVLHSLETGMPALRSAPALPAGGAGTGGVSAGGPVPVPTVAPLPRIVVQPAAPLAASPAPAVNASTGASHALP